MIWKLDVYLDRASRGDREAAYIASHLLKAAGESDTLVQTQLRRSAEAGYAPAIRELACLSFTNGLLPQGYTDNNDGNQQAQGRYWLHLGATQNDIVSMALLAYCLESGALGFDVDKKSSAEYRKSIAEHNGMSNMIYDILSCVLFANVAQSQPEVLFDCVIGRNGIERTTK